MRGKVPWNVIFAKHLPESREVLNSPFNTRGHGKIDARRRNTAQRTQQRRG